MIVSELKNNKKKKKTKTKKHTENGFEGNIFLIHQIYFIHNSGYK